MKTLYRLALAALGSLLLANLAWAQRYPSRPVTIVVPFSAGAGTDVMARILAEKLALRIGQPVVVENRAGAGGLIGTSHVAKSRPDGYTLLFVPNSIAFAHLVIKAGEGVRYDPVRDFTPIIEAVSSPVFLLTGPSSGFKTLKDAITAAKSDRVPYGSAGAGSIIHVVGESVNKVTGTQFEHVPYKGAAQALSDVMAGHIPLTYAQYPKSYISGGKLIPLASTGKTRASFAPNVPTFKELGYDYELECWFGIFGPKGTPPEVVDLLNRHLNDILKMPDVIEGMESWGGVVVGGPPESLRDRNAKDVKDIGKIIRELGLEPS